jgi:hypothetical protein
MRNGQFLTHLEVARPDSHSLHACRSNLRISLDSHMHAAEGPTCCNHPLKHKFACCSPPRPTFGACSLFSTVTLDRDTCTQRPTCSQQPATGSQVAGGKHSNTYRTTPYHTTSMDINQDRAYDLDLQSLLPPTPGAQGSVPAAHIDGWLGHVEPGGLRHDEIAVLGTRTSTVRHQRLHGGTVFDDNGVPLDMNDNVAYEDVRTLDQWPIGMGGTAVPSTPTSSVASLASAGNA